MSGGWLRGLLRRRGGRLAGLAVGVALTVALLASLGSFIAAAKAGMTRQALRGIAVDWQVAVGAGADPRAVLDTTRAEPGTRVALPVGYAGSPGLSATTVPPGGGPASRQTTGTATVLGWPAGYAATFPGTLRLLAGSPALSGATGHAPPAALLAQQTAANLHARPGDQVAVGRAGLPPVRVRVVGVVDLPQADALFQRVGAPAGAQPTAPPDNVAVLNLHTWTATFAPLAAARPGLVQWQVHAARDRTLPADPASAYARVLGQAHHLEVRLAGTGTVGDNLAASLDAARADALYAQVLFVFLGLPAAVLAALLTVTLAGAGVARRRREAALLRLRGAQVGTAVRLAGIEAAVVAAAGIAFGLAAAAVTGRTAFGSVSFGATTAAAIGWMALAAGLGGLLAAAAIVIPAWRDARAVRVAAVRAAADHRPAERAPRWARFGLDVALLAAAAAVYWVTSRSGYSLVLAPEGVPTVSVSYWAFAGPALLWAGAGLLTYRLVDLLLRRGRRLTAAGLRPVAGPLAGLSAASMARQRRPLARATVLAALAVTFAASTAVFNTTYAAQADLDARLTNGADVTVTEPPTAAAGPQTGARIAAVPGVTRVEPLQHRYAYVGTDLQDLYGIQPTTIAAATRLADTYFTGGSARDLLGRLAAQPDAVLVSAETVRDYQLRAGDRLTLRLASTGGALVAVPFHYAGVANEFPTAPKDSFLVANAGYITHTTGNDAVGSFLVTASDPPAVAQRLRAALGPGPTVTDITAARTAVGTGLTAIDLAGLTRVELGFGLLLTLAAGGLVLGLSRAERRRELAIAAALGARRPQLRALLAGDALLVTVGGLAAGAVTAGVLAAMLVAVLTGVFDPPPDQLSVPWAYLTAAAALTAAGTITAAGIAVRRAGRALTATLRDL